MTAKIMNVVARQILDSYGNPTIETDIILESGAFGRNAIAILPNHDSTNPLEGCAKDSSVIGDIVSKNITTINTLLKKRLVGFNAEDQRLFDSTLINDLVPELEHPVFSRRSAFSLSLACAKAAASHLEKPLFSYLMNDDDYIMPVPMISVVRGSTFSGVRDYVNDIMIMPVNFTKFSDALFCGVKIFHALEASRFDSLLLSNNNFFSNSKNILSHLVDAIENTGYRPGRDVYIALRANSDKLYTNGCYSLSQNASENIAHQELVSYWQKLISSYPIISIEDPMASQDIEGWKLLTSAIGKKVQLVGNNIFSTNTKKLKEGINLRFSNSILINPAQTGTLTSTLQTMSMAAEAGYTCIISSLKDNTSVALSDLSVATGSGQIQAGSICYSSCVQQYNQLLRIEEDLQDHAIYPGIKTFNFSTDLESNSKHQSSIKTTKNTKNLKANQSEKKEDNRVVKSTEQKKHYVMKKICILLAAGKSKRMQQDLPKQYMKLDNGLTVLDTVLSAFLSEHFFDYIVVVNDPDCQNWQHSMHYFCPTVMSCSGGQERANSVFNALIFLGCLAKKSDWIIVHDAARVLTTLNDIRKLYNYLVSKNTPGGILASRTKNTVKIVNQQKSVVETIDRNSIYFSETPQIFKYHILIEGYSFCFKNNIIPTDESAAVECLGHKPVVLENTNLNLKITVPDDLKLVNYLLFHR